MSKRADQGPPVPPPLDVKKIESLRAERATLFHELHVLNTAVNRLKQRARGRETRLRQINDALQEMVLGLASRVD